jgi:hypothetical protein
MNYELGRWEWEVGKWGSGGMERINKNNLPNTDDSLPKTKALYLSIKI